MRNTRWSNITGISGMGYHEKTSFGCGSLEEFLNPSWAKASSIILKRYNLKWN